MSGPVTPPLEVTEVDGSPDGRPITKIVVSNGDLTISGRTATIDTTGSGGTPGGSDTEVQYNNAGVFGGDSDFTFDGTTVTIENSCYINGDINSVVTGGSDFSLVARATIGGYSQGLISFGGGDDSDMTLSAGKAGEAGNILLLAGSGSGKITTDSPFDSTTTVDADGVRIGSGVDGNQITTNTNDDLVLDTNTGTNSGSITIQEGADNHIQIVPDGAGDVELGNFNFDVDQSVGAGQDNYVLTYDNAGGKISLEAAGGGGTPGTPADSIQFNSDPAGTFTGSADLTWDGTRVITDTLSSVGTNTLTLQTNSGTTTGKIEILNGGVPNHINITPASGTTNLVGATIRIGNASTGTITTSSANNLILNTNDGTNSGTITITDGVDGDISLTPNGAGAVEISSAYKLPTAVTGANDYVLTAQTDGTTAWAAAGGGGNVFNAEIPGDDSVNDRFIISQTPPWGSADKSTTVNLSTMSKPMCFPFIAPATGDITEIGINLTTADAGNLYVAIYDSGTEGLADSLVCYATIAIDGSTGNLYQTSITGADPAVTRGEQYWYSFSESESSGAYAMAALVVNTPGVGLGGNITQDACAFFNSAATAYAVPPASFTNSYSYGGIERPLCSLKIA